MVTTELQDLLRFLSKDANLSLAVAMKKAQNLQQASLMTPEAIARRSVKELQSLLGDEKLAKQVRNAAKRMDKKRSTSDESLRPTKRSKHVTGSSSLDPSSPEELESSLALPFSDASEADLRKAVFYTNRAPLLLAFVVTLLKYTMPGQPISSKLSLAYAYISTSSRSRAVDLGIEKEPSAEQDGWGQGQPFVTIMGKRIRVMRRSGYELIKIKKEGTEEAHTADADEENEVAFWGLDLEALRSSNTPTGGKPSISHAMPIYTPQSGRSYLAKAAQLISNDNGSNVKKKTAAEVKEETEYNLGILLKAIDLVYQSWESEIDTVALDRKTWTWYAQVRPDVAYGRDGWGEKNVVRVSSILDLRRKVETPEE